MITGSRYVARRRPFIHHGAYDRGVETVYEVELVARDYITQPTLVLWLLPCKINSVTVISKLRHDVRALIA